MYNTALGLSYEKISSWKLLIGDWVTILSKRIKNQNDAILGSVCAHGFLRCAVNGFLLYSNTVRLFPTIRLSSTYIPQIPQPVSRIIPLSGFRDDVSKRGITATRAKRINVVCQLTRVIANDEREFSIPINTAAVQYRRKFFVFLPFFSPYLRGVESNLTDSENFSTFVPTFDHGIRCREKIDVRTQTTRCAHSQQAVRYREITIHVIRKSICESTNCCHCWIFKLFFLIDRRNFKVDDLESLTRTPTRVRWNLFFINKSVSGKGKSRSTGSGRALLTDETR